jgi:RHS repeat-associated protein
VRHYAVQDANFNVTAIVASADATVLERLLYDPYGSVTVLDPSFAVDADGVSDLGWVYLHQGGRYDTDSGLYHFRHRDYSPTLGRWVQQDPLGDVSSSNLYEGLSSNPLNRVDPHGTRDDEPGLLDQFAQQEKDFTRFFERRFPRSLTRIKEIFTGVIESLIAGECGKQPGGINIGNVKIPSGYGVRPNRDYIDLSNSLIQSFGDLPMDDVENGIILGRTNWKVGNSVFIDSMEDTKQTCDACSTWKIYKWHALLTATDNVGSSRVNATKVMVRGMWRLEGEAWCCGKA